MGSSMYSKKLERTIKINWIPQFTDQELYNKFQALTFFKACGPDGNLNNFRFCPESKRLLNSFYPQSLTLLNSFYPQSLTLLNSFYPQSIRLLNS
jgi:hypothetical protein